MPATREVNRCRSRSFVARRELTTAFDDSLRRMAGRDLNTCFGLRGKLPPYLIRPKTDPAPPFMLDIMWLADAAVDALALVDEDCSDGVEAAVVAFVLGVGTSDTFASASCAGS